METPGAADVNAYPTCKICDRGTLRPRKIRRLSGPAVAIGYVLLIPSILGMAACAILLVGIAIAAGPALIRGSGALAVVLSGSGIMADVLIGIGCFVGGLLGWLLVMKRDVLQCDNCGAVVNASATIKSHPNRSIARASVFGFFFLLLILVAMAVVLSHRGNSPAQATIVPFVGCKSDGQVGPQDAPTGEPKTVTISPELAQMIAYYKASDGSGVLAPRGWYCFGTYGSSGSNLYVTPMPLNSTDLFSDSWKGVPSYGIQLSESDGGTSGRFAVAEIIARVFPAHWSFVRQVTGEGIEPASSFPYGPYPTDKLIYKDKETVEYVTPPNTEGLGTQSYLAKDGDPINGVAILTGKDPDLTKLAARLPPEMSDLLPVVIRQVEQDSSQPAAEPAQSDTMQPFTSTEGRFSVLFPGAPRQASQPVHWKNGETGTIHDFIATADNGKTGYVVGYTDSAPDVVAEGAQAHLQRTENGFIAGKTLLSDKVIDLDGVSGRAFTAADSRSNYIVREFVAGTRFYRLTVITPKGYTATQADQFTDSFRILDMPDQVGQCRITSVKKIDTRLEGTPGSGSAIEFINGGYQVSYDTVPAIEKSLPGDQVKFCLVSIPANCPAGDARGREYKTENLRTGESWTLPDSEHECGGA